MNTLAEQIGSEVKRGVLWEDITRGMRMIGWWGNGEIDARVHEKYVANGHYMIQAARYWKDSRDGNGKDIWCDIYEIKIKDGAVWNPLRCIGSIGAERETALGFADLEETMRMGEAA